MVSLQNSKKLQGKLSAVKDALNDVNRESLVNTFVILHYVFENSPCLKYISLNNNFKFITLS